MSDPVRLDDDPEFLRETGLRLKDALPPPEHDLAALKERVLRQAAVIASAPSLPSAPSPASSAGAGAAKAAAVKASIVVAAFAAGFGVRAIVTPEPVPPPPVVIRVPVPVEVPVPATPPAPVPPPQPIRAKEPPRVKETPAPTPPAPAPVEKPAEPPPVRQLPSLADQLRLYESGRTALKAGNHAVAVREFSRYLESIPDGELWPESAMGLLDALLKSGAHARAESHATMLLEDARMRGFSTEILRKRALSRASLGRCDGALEDVAAMPAGAERERTREAVNAACGR